MEIKKDVGQAIEEHLTHLNESPDDLVWKNIEEELKKEKKDRYIIPFWLRYVSIGAILFILLLNRNSSSSPIKPNDTNKEKHQKTSITNKNNQFNQDKITKQNTNNTSERHRNKNSNSYKNSIIKEKKTVSAYSNKKNINNFSSVTINTAVKTDSVINNTSQSVFKLNTKKVDSQATSTKTSETSKTKESVEEAILIAEKKHETEKDSVSNSKTKNKWSIYPNISLVSYNGFNESFKDKISVNYGVLLKYQISEEGSIRLGVSKLDLQHTYEINTVSITQEVSYFEIPLEFNYMLSKKKVQISLIGGFSYFITTDAHQKSLNENNNLIQSNNKDVFNSSTMSLNLGLNFNAKVYNNFYLNIEPIFKYQLSPYTDTVNFNPYLISISSGIEYKF
ncbi:MAG: outer membrane beta-barrel protein [Algicola sp.]|nr:outer membrane beta-barrel protein [Algicola sp.]